MPDWKIKQDDVHGGSSGKLLEGCEIRENADGTYDFITVLATTKPDQQQFEFPEFAYRGLIWCVGVTGGDVSQLEGQWGNNQRHQPRLPGEESGTYTAQSGSGLPEGGEEDASSASA